MKLTFKISPNTTGFTAKILYPDYSKLKFSLDNDNGKGKFLVNGSIKLTSEDSTFLADTVGTTAHNIKAYLKGNLYFTCDYKSINTINQDSSFNQVALDLTAETVYNSDEWKNFDLEYNINTLEPETENLYFQPGFYPVVNDPDAGLFFDVELNPLDLSPFEVANWDIAYIAVLSSAEILGVWYYSIAVQYKRVFSYGYYIGSTLYDPDGVIAGTGDWSVITGTEFKKDITPIYVAVPTSPEPYSEIRNDAEYFYKPAIEYVDVTRKVTDIIEFLFSEMGLTTINFDDTGTSTDSFYSFKNITGFERLLVINLTDFIPADDDGQKDVIAANTEISLKTLLDYFETLGFEWFIQDRSGTDYFILQHKSHKSLGSGNPDLTNYYNKNRTYLANKWTKEPPEYHKIVNETTCKSVDFKGTEITFNKTFGTDSEKVITDNKIFLDIDDISVRRSDPYSDIDTSNIVIISAYTLTGKDYVYQPTGLVSGTPKNNYYLSFNYGGRVMYTDYPDENYTMFGADYTAASYQLRKRDKIDLTMPADNIQDYSVSDYVSFFGNETEIDKVDQNGYDTICKLTLKK